MKNNITRLSSYRIGKFTKEEKHEMYKKALDKLSNKITAREAGTDVKANLIKMNHYALMYLKTMPNNYSYEQLKVYEEMMWLVRGLMRYMTIKELKQCYPIDKTFDGARWECKDYFSATELMSKYDENEVIGDDLDEVLWEHFNSTIMKAHVQMLCVMSEIRRSRGEQGLMEKFAQDNQIPLLRQKGDTFKVEWQKPNLTVVE
ncbi:MAG: hypothetical protein RR440_00425 [Erysipelotrichaceae bacterium]